MRDYYVELYRHHHSRHKNYGEGGLYHLPRIFSLLRSHNLKTVLDYGCGKGRMVKALNSLNFNAVGYDPAVLQYTWTPTGTYDAVVCLDVLEHIPEEDIPHTLSHIVSYEPRLIYLNICLVEARTVLPDGRNAHETVRPADWWLDQILDMVDDYRLDSVDTNTYSTTVILLREDTP